jgi:hypothetical protein
VHTVRRLALEDVFVGGIVVAVGVWGIRLIVVRTSWCSLRPRPVSATLHALPLEESLFSTDSEHRLGIAQALPPKSTIDLCEARMQCWSV